MQQSIAGSFLAFLTASLLALAGCSQPENDIGKRTRRVPAKQATAGVLEANSDDATAKGKGDGAGKGEVPAAGEEPGKGADPGKGDGGEGDGGDGGVDVVDEIVDLEEPGTIGKGDPTQTPAQTKPVPIDAPDVVVELPKEACPYFDPAKPAFVIAKSQFAPSLPPMDVPSGHIQGALEADGETFIGAFTLFLYPNEVWSLNWDGKAGRIPHDYTMVVIGASDASCIAYLKFVKQEPRTLNGCFAAGTKIRMASGKDQVVAALTVGDLVLNPVTKSAAKVAEVRKGPETRPLWAIGFGGREMHVTELHPVPVRGGVKQAHAVTTDDYIYDENGVFHRVTKAAALPAKDGGETVYNLRLDGATTAFAQHMVLADGVVSGDLYLQRKLAGEGARTAGK